MRLKAYYTDGTTDEVDVGAAAQVALEDKFDILFTEAFDDGTDSKGKRVHEPRGRLKYLYFLTWASLRAADHEVEEDYDAWLKRLKDAGFALDQEGKPKAKASGNPTGRGRSRAASSS